MPVKELKEKLHQLIESIDDELLLESLLEDTETRLHSKDAYLAEGLSEDDYNELMYLAKEDPLKHTIGYDELKSSLARWFKK